MKLDIKYYIHKIRIESTLKTSILNELTELQEKQRHILTLNDEEDEEDN